MKLYHIAAALVVLAAACSSETDTTSPADGGEGGAGGSIAADAGQCVPPTACHLTAESYPGGPWCSVETLPDGYDCSNGAECTASTCRTGACVYAPAPDGSFCADGKGTCAGGACVTG